MSDDFYAKLGSQQDIMQQLKKSVFEAFTLFHIAIRVNKKRERQAR